MELRTSGTYVIMSTTFRRALGARLLILWVVMIFGLSLNLPVLTLFYGKILAAGYIPATLPFFIAVSVPFVPLLPLLLGATSITEERENGTLQLLLSHPITRSDYYLGRWLGLVLATSVAVVLGYGAAAVFAYGTNLAGYASVYQLVLVAIALDVSMVGLALLLSTLIQKKANALIAGAFLWFLMTQLSQYIIFDAYSISDYAYQLVYVSILFNPALIANSLAGFVGGGSYLGAANGAGSLAATGAAIAEVLTTALGAGHVLQVLAELVVFWSAAYLAIGYVIFTRVEVVIIRSRREFQQMYPHLFRNIMAAVLVLLVVSGGYIGVSSVAQASTPYPAKVGVSGVVGLSGPMGDSAIPISIQFEGTNHQNYTATVSANGRYSLVLANKMVYNTTLTYRDLAYDLYYCGLGTLNLAAHSNSTGFSATCPSAVPIGY